jgi:hypothetical protein
VRGELAKCYNDIFMGLVFAWGYGLCGDQWLCIVVSINGRSVAYVQSCCSNETST